MPGNLPFQAALTSLLQTSLAKGESARLEVISGSMRPWLQPGDRVVAGPVRPEDLRTGQVVVIRREQDFLTHRLIAHTCQGWIAKGDRLLQADAPVPAEQIIARVVAVERGTRCWRLDQPAALAAGWLLGQAGRCIAGIYEFNRALHKE